MQNNGKELETDTNNENIQPGHMNWIWQRKMYHAHKEKWEKRNNERNRIGKSGQNQNAWRKGNLQVLWNIGNGHHQTSENEKRKKENITFVRLQHLEIGGQIEIIQTTALLRTARIVEQIWENMP